MVGLVFEGLGEEVVGGANAELLAVDVEGADADLLGALDGAAVAGDAEASLSLDLSLPLGAHHLRVDEHGGFVVIRQLDDSHAK